MYFTSQIRGNWHWGFPVSWLDFYTGFGMGLDIIHTRYRLYTTNYSDTDVEFYWGFQAGAHFYFSDVIGVVAETGYPFYLKAGVALKFGGR